MRAQLLGGVVLEELRGGWRRGLRAGARLLAHIEHVVVGHERRLLHMAAESLPQRRLRDAVEVDVVLADELVCVRIGLHHQSCQSALA